MPAWKKDVQLLARDQLDVAIEVYQQKQRSLVLQKVEIERSGATDARGYLYVSQDLDDTNRKLDELRERKIEVGR